MSKALDKSKNIVRGLKPRSRYAYSLSISSRAASSVEWFFRKPYWFSDRLFTVKWLGAVQNFRHFHKCAKRTLFQTPLPPPESVRLKMLIFFWCPTRFASGHVPVYTYNECRAVRLSCLLCESLLHVNVKDRQINPISTYRSNFNQTTNKNKISVMKNYVFISKIKVTQT